MQPYVYAISRITAGQGQFLAHFRGGVQSAGDSMSRQQPADVTLVNPATGEPWTIRDAVFAVMPEAKQAAGDIVSGRTLYYKVRPCLQKLAGADTELDYGYYATKLLPAYQAQDDDGVLDGLYYDKRGELVLPHDDKVIPLGTRQVNAFEIPEYHFDKILVIEKEGLEGQLEPFRIGQRFDMAIAYCKGTRRRRVESCWPAWTLAISTSSFYMTAISTGTKSHASSPRPQTGCRTTASGSSTWV